MNYTIIFCLLIALINSKILGDTFNCVADSKEKCLAIMNPKRDFQCCYEVSKTDFGNSEKCLEFPKDIETYQKMVKSSQYKAMLKERYGYSAFNEDSLDLKVKSTFNCNNGELSYSFGYDTYTENEKNILKNENHCLNKNSLKQMDYNYDVGKCEEGLLLESSKSAGLQCGYFLFNIKINSEKSLTYKTCDLFDLDIFSTLIKLEQKNFDGPVVSFIRTQNYSSFESYNAELYGIKGKKLKYDSLTKKIIIDDPDDELAFSSEP